MGPEDRPAAIVLAAGLSSRLGRPKQLLLHRGEPLVRRASRLALEAGAHPVWVVIPHYADPPRAEAFMEALADLPSLAILENLDAAEGMGSSLRLAMASLLATHPLPVHVLLMVCDQPLLEVQHFRALLDAQSDPRNDAGITAAFYNGRSGVPAVFAQRHFSTLAESQGDAGARTLLRQSGVTTVDLPEASVDIDTEQDLQFLV